MKEHLTGESVGEIGRGGFGLRGCRRGLCGVSVPVKGDMMRLDEMTGNASLLTRASSQGVAPATDATLHAG